MGFEPTTFAWHSELSEWRHFCFSSKAAARRHARPSRAARPRPRYRRPRLDPSRPPRLPEREREVHAQRRAERGHVHPCEYRHLAQRAQPLADLRDEQLRLLPGREVPALVELVVVDEV